MIEIKSLTFSYKNHEKKALDGVNLTIPDGGFLGIIGPSGAGKSTLTYALNGVIPHHYRGDYYGSVTINGQDAFDTSLTDLSLSVGTVFQDISSQMVAADVDDEILYGLENFGIPKDEIPKRVDEALELVGISHLKNKRIASLSGGQKQKVAIASIIALRPKVLILDEPTGELDPKSSRQIFSLLRRFNEEYGMTIVVVEQKIMLLSEFAKDLAVMSDGRILHTGPVRSVLAHTKELEQIGVNVPRVVTLSAALKAEGVGTGAVCLNLDETERYVKELLS
ncbi:MAG: ABC transporter ATP-binding protein [Lachnospiraceae bacterium]|nr:ABC transporter ATP-binding protein [Lachnospiraceae bacterium]